MPDLRWRKITSLVWRADPYLVTASERIEDFKFTGTFNFAAHLLTIERGSVVASVPIGPPAATLEAAQRQAQRHADRRKGAA